jgi:hypothetical protein
MSGIVGSAISNPGMVENVREAVEIAIAFRSKVISTSGM